MKVVIECEIKFSFIDKHPNYSNNNLQGLYIEP